MADPIKANNQALKIAADAANEDNMFLKERLEKRAARLRGEVAVLKVGAANDMAREHKKDKADDAIHSVKLALAEGVVPGAGAAWKEVSNEMKDADTPGGRIIKRALLYPSSLLGIENAINKSAIQLGGKESGEVWDSFVVEKTALTNAAETAGIFLTTKYALLEKDDPKSND